MLICVWNSFNFLSLGRLSFVARDIIIQLKTKHRKLQQCLNIGWKVFWPAQPDKRKWVWHVRVWCFFEKFITRSTDFHGPEELFNCGSIEISWEIIFSTNLFFRPYSAPCTIYCQHIKKIIVFGVMMAIFAALVLHLFFGRQFVRHPFGAPTSTCLFLVSGVALNTIVLDNSSFLNWYLFCAILFKFAIDRQRFYSSCILFHSNHVAVRHGMCKCILHLSGCRVPFVEKWNLSILSLQYSLRALCSLCLSERVWLPFLFLACQSITETMHSVSKTLGSCWPYVNILCAARQ